jgi:hypothetical protein
LTYSGDLNRLTDIECWEREKRRVNFVYHDLRAPLDPIYKHLFRIDYVIHAAAESHVDNSIRNPRLFAESNVLGTVNMLELCRQIQPEKFIYVSCYDTKTRALTLDGYKTYDEIKVGDVVLSINPKNNVTEWKRVNKVIIQDYSGDMVHFDGQSVDLLVTPNHRMLVTKMKGGLNYWMDAENQSQRSVGKLPIGEAAEGKNGDIDPDILFLIGVYIGDGHTYHTIKKSATKSGMNKQNYMQSGRNLLTGRFGKVVPKNEYISEQNSYRTFFEVPDNNICRRRLIETLDNLSIKYTANKKNIYVGGKQWHELFKECGQGEHNKYIPEKYLTMGKAELQIIFDGMILSDGSYLSGDCIQYTTVSEKLTAQMAILASQLGWKIICRKRFNSSFIGLRKVEGWAYYLNLSRKCLHSINKYIAHTEKYTGKIWCLSVEDNKNFLVERNGNFAYCGNTDEV